MLFRDRHYRFQPLTVRAATRALRMGQCGRLSEVEVIYCLQALAGLEPHARLDSGEALLRLARRAAALYHAGAPRPTGRHRRQVASRTVPAVELPY
jgi:hypothetical protein